MVSFHTIAQFDSGETHCTTQAIRHVHTWVKQRGDSARGLSVCSCLPASTEHTGWPKLATTSKDKCRVSPLPQCKQLHMIIVIRVAFECSNINKKQAVGVFATSKQPHNFFPISSCTTSFKLRNSEPQLIAGRVTWCHKTRGQAHSTAFPSFLRTLLQ